MTSDAQLSAGLDLLNKHAERLGLSTLPTDPYLVTTSMLYFFGMQIFDAQLKRMESLCAQYSNLLEKMK